jgi:pulcherriminic acid synthase
VSSGFRSYEVFQRQRPGQTTEKIKPKQLTSAAYLTDPYPLLAILRENYPCYRDWPGNSFWITRYDDVTSVFTDDANFETRSKRWFYGMPTWADDLRGDLAVEYCIERRTDSAIEPLVEGIVRAFGGLGSTDLATEFAARLAIELLARVLDLPLADVPMFAERYWRMQRGWHWEPRAQQNGREAITELVSYFAPLIAARKAAPGDDLVSVIAGLGGSAETVVATLLEDDHETLHGSLANLMYLLLTHPDQLAAVKAEPRLTRFAWFETLRHSAPVLSAKRFTKHEVERFGLLLPEGALVICSAAAANRDPRIFDQPDVFDHARKDLCQREPRGQYRADGLPAGVCVGAGKPSKFPAVPEDRPRSRYAITRDVVVTAVNYLFDRLPDLHLEPGATPTLRSLRIGEMHTCWELSVVFSPKG